MAAFTGDVEFGANILRKYSSNTRSVLSKRSCVGCAKTNQQQKRRPKYQVNIISKDKLCQNFLCSDYPIKLCYKMMVVLVAHYYQHVS